MGSRVQKWKKLIPKFEKFRGTLADGPKQLAACLKFDEEFDRVGERLGTYAFLKSTEDQASSNYQRMKGRQHTPVAKRAKPPASSARRSSRSPRKR